MSEQIRALQPRRAEPPTQAEVEPSITLSKSAMRALRTAVVEALGAEKADDVLFRIGRSWGWDAARKQDRTSGTIRSRLLDGLQGLERVGLGRVSVDALELDAAAGDLRLRGHVLDQGKLEARAASEERAEICGLTAGYLTGLVGTTTEIDVVCSPFHCSNDCPLCGCNFEIVSSHRINGVSVEERRAPAGSARFFLGSLGAALGERDISLSDLVENAGDAIVLVDTNNVVRFWSRSAETLFQYTREEVVGRRVGLIVPPDLLEEDELGTLRTRLEQEGHIENFVTRRMRKDGEELWVTLNRSILHDSKGHVVGSTAILRDITESVRNQEELHRSRNLAMIGELSSKIAHEIKNPLAGIYGATQILARGMEPEDPRQEALEGIAGEIRRLDETVQDLLRFARPAPPKPSLTALRSFVRDSLEWIGFQADAVKYEFEIDIDEDLMVPLDPKLMGQAFSNLVHNAMQAMAGGGTVFIRAERDNGLVTLEVSDSGPGIAADSQESIFEPFFTTKSRGSGLGLPIAKKNVEAHGGTIAVANLVPHGCSVRITLPGSVSSGDLVASTPSDEPS